MNINKKISLLLLLMLAVAAANLFVVYRYQDTQKHDNHIVNVAGRQRMLSQKISRLALSIVYVNDNTNDRQFLEEAVNTYDLSLQTLWNGGESMGIIIPPAPSIMNELFQYNSELWQSFKKKVAIAIKNTHDTKTSRDAIDFIRQNNDKLLNLNNEITHEFERIFSAKNFKLRIILPTMLVCDIIIFIIGYLFCIRISKPIKELSEAAKKVGEGDYSRKLEFSSHDEVGTLGKTFNKMIDNIERSRSSLVAAKEFTDTILRSMIDPLILVDLEGTIKGINQATSHLLGYTEEELLGKPVGIIFKFKEEAPKKTRLQELTKEGFIRNCKTKSGENIPIGLHTSTMQDLNGKLLGYVCIARDMRQINDLILELDTANAKLKNWSKTLEEKVEERTAELKLQRYYLKKAQEIGTIGTWELDVHKNKIYWTDENYRIFGALPGTELTYDDFLNCVHPEDRDYVQKEWNAALSNNKPYDIEHRIVAGNNIKWIREKAELEFDEKGDCIRAIGFSQDITDRKQAEENLKLLNETLEKRVAERAEELTEVKNQLYHAQKMESIGRLAGGVAHDFNNMLMAIIGYANLTEMQLKEDDPAREYLSKIIESSNKATNLTQSLLAFSRRQPVSLEPVNLNDVIRQAEQLFLRIAGENIKCNVILADKDLKIMADKDKIEQVLINLVSNAADAMPKGGKVCISTDIVKLESAFVNNYELKNTGEYARITISDTGIGMSEDIKGKIFEPFFTTKDRGKGTGIGLSIVYGILRQHNGCIEVASEPGKGTTCTLYLPLTDQEIIYSDKKEVAKTQAAVFTKAKTILLAEDEKAVREIVTKTLEYKGYEVIASEDGDDAIQKYKENKGHIDLLLFDVMMPKKSGKDAYNIIKKQRSDIKIIFMSGYSEDITTNRAILNEGLYFLQKPVTPDKLLQKIAEVLSD
ncbi:MAG: PAS domain S-box protein [Planctomycetes bacterium]|nr:PAS domain S-box protein [Planctomycetota bacterium]